MFDPNEYTHIPFPTPKPSSSSFITRALRFLDRSKQEHPFLTHKAFWVAVCLGFLLLVGGICYFLWHAPASEPLYDSRMPSSHASTSSDASGTSLEALDASSTSDESVLDPAESKVASGGDEVVVHVSGAVASPGLVHVTQGARVDDALSASGGPTEDADVGALNLARLVKDGEHIVVPRVGESAHDTTGIIADGGASENQSSGKDQSSAGQSGVSSDGRININRASATELQSINGIGERTAEQIIQYRSEHGAFSTPEEIMNISGIGKKKFEKIAPYIVAE